MDSPFSRINARWVRLLILTALTLFMALPGLAGIQVIDRDEARYVQASVQMAESGDLLNIRFQDQARNKKPAGIYWMQTAAIKAFTKDGERKIWVQRLPSVLGALLAVLATYWGGSRLIGRDGAFIAAMLLAVSGLFVFEAHIAKTDAVLCGLSALVLGALAHVRNGGTWKSAFLFWIALGAAIMIKGPILPGIVTLTILTLLIWERRAAWLNKLINWPGILVFILMIVPWAVAIWMATDGQFFADSLGQDFGGKIVGVQEKHPGPPGYFSGLIWALFWPSAIFLLPGLAFAVRASRAPGKTDSPVVSGAKLLLAWTLPFWIVLELMPTKLPHYPLPLFPALAMMSGAAVMTLFSVKEFPVTRRIGAVMFFLITTALCAGIIWGVRTYGSDTIWPMAVSGFIVLLALFTAVSLWRMKTKRALWGSLATGAILSLSLYQFAMPSLTQLRLSDRVNTAFLTAKITRPQDGGTVFSPHFREPSLVYRLGQSIALHDDKLMSEAVWNSPFSIILDVENPAGKTLRDDIKGIAEQKGSCLRWLDPIHGLNYSKGDPVSLLIMEIKPCPGEL